MKSFGELGKAVETPTAHVPTAFLVLPNFHLCFYSSIATRYMFSISKNIGHDTLSHIYNTILDRDLVSEHLFVM